MNRKMFILMLCFIFYMGSVASSKEVLKIGSMENYAPYNFKKDGKYTGLDVEIIETVFNELGVKVKHIPKPWKRALIEFESGKTDSLFQLTPKPERFKKWNMVELRSNDSVYFVKSDSPIVDIKSIKELTGLRVGVGRGFSYGGEFDTATSFHREEVESTKQNISKLLLGRVDIIRENEIPVKYELKQMNLEAKIRMLPTPGSKAKRYIAFHRDKRGNMLAKKFTDQLNSLKENGKLKEIFKKWK